jgi:hypothetical protein
VHDSQAFIPSAKMSAEPVTSLYDIADSAYCSPLLREFSRELDHVPLIDHNPHGGEKIAFAPHEAERFRERSTAERANARLNDEFGARHVRVRGATKVMAHLITDHSPNSAAPQRNRFPEQRSPRRQKAPLILP